MHSLVKRINKIKYNKDSNIKTFTSKTHGLKDIIFYNKRLKTLRLTWCKQICDLIENIYPQKKIKINDIGCCYFQLYKEIKLRKLNYNYYGSEKNFCFGIFQKLGLSNILRNFLSLFP